MTDIIEPSSMEILNRYGISPEEGMRIEIRSKRAGKFATYETARALAVDSMTREHRFQTCGIVVFESDSHYEISWDPESAPRTVHYEWVV